MKRGRVRILLFIFSLSVFVNLRGQNDSRGLIESIKHSFNEAKPDKNFWIGYSILRRDAENITIGSFYYDDFAGPSLRDLLNNPGDYKSGQSKKLKRNKGTIHSRHFGGDSFDREVAILFRYDNNSVKPDDFAEINVCSMSSYVDLNDLPVYWLGQKTSKESAGTLINIYNTTHQTPLKKELIAPIAIHSDETDVTDFLHGIYKSKAQDELREEAVFWLGFQNSPDVLGILKNIINNDRSPEIKEKAVMAIGQLKTDEAVDELISIARSNLDHDLREEAILWLGQIAVKKAEAALKNFVENDPDIEIKKRALFALANNSDENVPFLIELANSNKSLQIRKHAIWALGNCEDKRALDALIKLVKK